MKYKHLNILEREKIQELLWQKVSIRKIAKTVGRSHSSILRELNRSNKGRTYQYSPRLAEERAQFKKKSRGRKNRLKNQIIRAYVVSHLKKHWSPEQISGRMKKEGIGDISHEAIYQFIYAQVYRNGWGEIKRHYQDLRVYLRYSRKRRLRKGVRRCQRVF
jgi:transposase, IS30 family